MQPRICLRHDGQDASQNQEQLTSAAVTDRRRRDNGAVGEGEGEREVEVMVMVMGAGSSA